MIHLVTCQAMRASNEDCDCVYGEKRKLEERLALATAAIEQAESAIIWLQNHPEPTGGQPERALKLIEWFLRTERERKKA